MICPIALTSSKRLCQHRVRNWTGETVLLLEKAKAEGGHFTKMPTMVPAFSSRVMARCYPRLGRRDPRPPRLLPSYRRQQPVPVNRLSQPLLESQMCCDQLPGWQL